MKLYMVVGIAYPTTMKISEMNVNSLLGALTASDAPSLAHYAVLAPSAEAARGVCWIKLDQEKPGCLAQIISCVEVERDKIKKWERETRMQTTGESE